MDQKSPAGAGRSPAAPGNAPAAPGNAPAASGAARSPGGSGAAQSPAASGAGKSPAEAAASQDGAEPAGAAARRRWPAPAEAAALALAAAFFLLLLAGRTAVDHDLFHGIALIREALQLGWIPRHDVFAYTPTVTPVVHHEWANALLIHAVATRAGAPGLMALKYLLSFGVVALAVMCARRRGAGWLCIAALAPLAALLGQIGFTTLRAQLVTLLFTAALLLLLDLDRQGRRWWIGPWLVLHVLWLNLHAGFVAGAGLLAVHGLEQALRGRGLQPHLLAAGAALGALVLVNPYGVDYPLYLVHGLSLPRPAIPEWWPLWRAPPSLVLPYLASLLVLAHAVLHLGWRQMPGLLLVLAGALAALRNVRSLPLYGVVWMALSPGWIEASPLGLALRRVGRWRGLPLAAGVAAGVLLAAALAQEPWLLRIPHRPEEVRSGLPVVYPVGAVRYLRQQRFAGNVMTPFRAGAYVTWRLYPAVRVSLDGRYEVAYRPGVFEEIQAFYQGLAGWQQTLLRYPTDLVLTRTDAPVAALLGARPDWRRVYTDGAFELYARPGLELPPVDWTGLEVPVSFP